MSDNNNNNTPPSPEDEPSAEEIAEAGTMRALEDLPSTATVKGDPEITKPTLAALSPEDRKLVIERAAGTDPEALDRALLEFLKDRQRDFRIKAGPGEGATATERAALSQINTLRLLGDELARHQADLDYAHDARIEYDDNGEAVAIPIYALQGAARTAREARIAEIKHEMALVAGIQGEADLKRAAREDAIRNRELQTLAYEARETKRRAHEMALEERINEAARRKAKLLRGDA